MNCFENNGGKNARRVWFRGEIFNSLVSVERVLKLEGKINVRRAIENCYTPDYEIIVIYKEKTFQEDFKKAKDKLLNILVPEKDKILERLRRVQNARP